MLHASQRHVLISIITTVQYTRIFLGYTAYCFLVEKAKLKEGDRVFINGGSGAVGVMAIQLAHRMVGSTGRVVATCSPAKSDILRGLGADEVLFSQNNYVNVPFRS